MSHTKELNFLYIFYKIHQILVKMLKSPALISIKKNLGKCSIKAFFFVEINIVIAESTQIYRKVKCILIFFTCNFIILAVFCFFFVITIPIFTMKCGKTLNSNYPHTYKFHASKKG